MIVLVIVLAVLLVLVSSLLVIALRALSGMWNW